MWSMSQTWWVPRDNGQSETGQDGQGDRMKHYRDDVRVALDARAHAESTDSPKKEALRMGTCNRTGRRWAKQGPPQVRQMSLYLANHPNPHRMIAHMQMMAESDVRSMTKAALIAEYRALLLRECDVEAQDRAGAVGTMSWLDAAAASEADAAVDIRKAAIEKEFAARRMSRAEVCHG